MFRISQPGRRPIIDVAQVDEIEPAIRARRAGRYHIDQV
jgi:hypothetical protein